MDSLKYRRILSLYLRGLLKPKKYNTFSDLREKILYEAILEEIYAKEYDFFANRMAICFANTNKQNLLKNSTFLAKQATALRKFDLKEYNKIDNAVNKFIDDLVHKYKVFEKLGLLESTYKNTNIKYGSK